MHDPTKRRAPADVAGALLSVPNPSRQGAGAWSTSQAIPWCVATLTGSALDSRPRLPVPLARQFRVASPLSRVPRLARARERVASDFDRLAGFGAGRWDHNRHYHPFLLRSLPARRERALEIGCGTGEFARLLAR